MLQLEKQQREQQQLQLKEQTQRQREQELAVQLELIKAHGEQGAAVQVQGARDSSFKLQRQMGGPALRGPPFEVLS